MVERGKPTCATAKKGDPHLRALQGAVRRFGVVPEHFGWTCASAKAPDWHRLASCTKAKSRVAAYAPAD